MQLEKNPKKLIETALPLESINKAGAREKSIRHGHPSTLHLWWSRKPLAVARAVIFAQMVDDPSEYVDVLLSDPSKKRAALRELRQRKAKNSSIQESNSSDRAMLEEIAAELERERLFDLIRELVKWENTNNARLLEQARTEIWQSWRRACAQNVDHPRAAELFDRYKLPAFHDPFAGGGALPLEAQRLGLEAHASDLNPVAVLINKAMIEIPPRFAEQPPVNPESKTERTITPRTWSGAQGLAEDVRYYGEWMRDEAQKRIGHLYPKIEITPEMVEERPDLKPYEGQKLTVIAWLWTRTVKSPNPAFSDVDVPLAYTFMLSTKSGKEAYVEPIINGKEYRFTVRMGAPPDLASAKRGTKLSRGANFKCLMSGAPISSNYVKQESMSDRIGSSMMAIVAEGKRGRVYLSPSQLHARVASKANPKWKPSQEMNRDTTNLVSGRGYGFFSWSDLFTSRQLDALTTFSDLISEAMDCIRKDAIATGLADDKFPFREGGIGATAYAQAVSVYLALSVNRLSDRGSTICSWDASYVKVRNTFSRQAIPMTWSYAEANPFSSSTGNWQAMVRWVLKCIKMFPTTLQGVASQANAFGQNISDSKVISTDPPYYDNIGYADLSDYFYIWLRSSLKSVFPGLFTTLAAPKSEELVATTYRHENKAAAEAFFLDGMTKAFRCLACQAHVGYPVTVYYAYKQAEVKGKLGEISTGWETFLGAVINAGFMITGTWPMRTELSNRMLSTGTNALASSVVLVCRLRPTTAENTTRRELVKMLRAELPKALQLLQAGNIAPVDLAQAAIGPGMEIYTRYAWSDSSLKKYSGGSVYRNRTSIRDVRRRKTRFSCNL